MNNKALAKGFKAAKKHLAHDYKDRAKEQLICSALGKAMELGAIDIATCDACTGVINKRLVQHTTYGSWLVYKGGVSQEELGADLNYRTTHGEKRQAGRHAWLDSLIKEFSV